MSNKLALATAYKRQHPEESFQTVSNAYNVASSTLYDHVTASRSLNTSHANKALSDPMEMALVNKVNDYADRGTLLSPAHVKSLAEMVLERKLGVMMATPA
ncbi:uncharacterized protein IL334_002062 [Kwoniella shivajii]|uniref:HTH psq-type domain-containing protein n=1 Tax=Kwoniella shivajii TaxID=564305 RepID=A0ABZ1CV96_9TREE|nr:hypothetical protein IL334_002062 [Kwoniella shivajii]